MSARKEDAWACYDDTAAYSLDIAAALAGTEEQQAPNLPAAHAAPAEPAHAACPQGWQAPALQALRRQPQYRAAAEKIGEELTRKAHRRAGGKSRHRVDAHVSLREWTRSERPTYARVAEAVQELCSRAPRQWAPAIRRMAQLPKSGGLTEIQNWRGAWDALDRLAEFDERHGDALNWVLTDGDIRQRAEHMAQQAGRGVTRIFARHGADHAQADAARQRLAACEEFERETRDKSEQQIRRDTGRSLWLWRQQAAMTPAEKDAATAAIERHRAALLEAIEYVVQMCRSHSCEPPKLKARATDEQMLGAVNRVKDAPWWRRALRKAAARIVEAGAIKLGAVNRRTGGYCSNDALERRRAQLRRNADALASTIFRNEAGQLFTLAELAAASVSNPVNRGGELMTRIRGCEEYADAQGHVGLFVTLTTPSAMHPMLSKEWRDKTDARDSGYAAFRAVKNPRYDGETTPRDAQQWLVKQWAKARAAMQRVGLKVYGFRVAEPHHDGTPHWHLLLWAKSEAEARQLQELLYEYWVRNDARYKKERGAAKNRTNFKRMERGGAAGYIAKYVAKSIGHHALQEHLDEAGAGELMTVEMGGVPGHQRVDAWASTWGIRQFQAIGQPSVTVWREVRRVTEDQVQALRWTEDPQARLAWDAAQKIGDKQADWCGFLRAMGGVCLRRNDYSLHAACRTTERLNRFGERSAQKKIVGVRTESGRWLISRRLGWVRLDESQSEEARAARARVSKGDTPQPAEERAAKAAPWTGFNNCTARLTQGRPNWLWKEAVEQAQAEAKATKWDLIGRYLHQRLIDDLLFFDATPAELDQVQPLHGPVSQPQALALLRRLNLTLSQALAGMERDGWTRNGRATYEAMCN